MTEIEKTARELIWAIVEKTLKSLKNEGLLKEPSKLQMLCSSPEMKSLIKKLSSQKYDPNRKFRKGDIVEMDTHGRNIAASMKKTGVELGKRYTVTEDESTTGHDIGYVSFMGDDGIEHHAMFFWLKLVTPVEERVPYSVGGSIDGCLLYKNGEHYAEFVNSIDAERACKLLNDEWRKEQK